MSRPAKPRVINWFGREVIVIDKGTHRGLPRKGQPNKTTTPWTREQDRLVRTLPIAEAVRATGRSRYAVEKRRGELGIAKPGRWTPEEDELLLHQSVKEVARRTVRSVAAVQARLQVLMWRA